MVLIGILIILLVLALLNADKIADLANKKISKKEKEKRSAEEQKQKRIEYLDYIHQRMEKLFARKRRLSIREAVDEMIENSKKESPIPSIQEEEKTVEHHIKKDLRGPILGNIYMDANYNLVHPFWRDEHSIYEDAKIWHNPYDEEE